MHSNNPIFTNGCIPHRDGTASSTIRNRWFRWSVSRIVHIIILYVLPTRVQHKIRRFGIDLFYNYKKIFSWKFSNIIQLIFINTAYYLIELKIKKRIINSIYEPYIANLQCLHGNFFFKLKYTANSANRKVQGINDFYSLWT